MRRRILKSSVAVAATLSLLVGGDAAAAGWVLPATPLATVANGPSGAVVAVDPAGDAVAAWTGDDGAGTQSLLVATRPAGGPWSTPEPLASRMSVDAPSVAIDAAGDATVLWVDSDDGSAFAAHAARHAAAGGGWSAPHDFAPAGTADPLTQVRANASGGAVAAWVEHDTLSGVAFVRAAVADATGTWDAPATVSDPLDASVAFGRPQIAPDASGGAIVGWTAQRLAAPFDFALQTSTRGSAWSAPGDLLSTDEPLSPLRLVGTGGDAAATWFQGSPATLWGAWHSGGSWTVDHVSDDVAPACTPLQALGPDDDASATVAWKAQSSDGLESVRLTAGGWEPQATVFASLTESVEDAAVDHGTVVLVAHDAGTGGDSVLASSRGAGGGWSAPALLDAADAGTALGGVDLATDAAGDALASWTPTDPLGAKSVLAAALQTAGPQLSDLTVPASGTAGAQLAFSAGARSTFAAVAQTTWDFGDGSAPATGASAGHAYAQAGDYTVTVTVTDSVGNATQARRQVAVAVAPDGRRPPDDGAPPGTTPPGGGTPPPARPAALVKPRVGGVRDGLLVLGRGSRTLRLTVRNRDAVRLNGAATLVRPRSGGRAALTLASRRRLTFAGGRLATLSLQLTDQALRALQRASGHRLPARFTLRLRAPDRRLVTVALTATLDGAARFAARPSRTPTARTAC
jgi:hypothetical protein